MTTRWLAETGGRRGPAYAEHFRRLTAQGSDMHAEARFVAERTPPGARILDAGCGTGRVAIELARRGFDVCGVDNDASMLAEAARDAPALAWVAADLRELPELGLEPFDTVVSAGNVLVYLAEGTEAEVVAALAGCARTGGLVINGWDTGRLAVADYDRWAAAAGLSPVERLGGWGGEAAGGGWCTAVDRR